MFGADTPLVIDAIQIALLAGAAGAAAIVLVLRRRKKADQSSHQTPSDLESRVRVLERIATDNPNDLAEEIEALRSTPYKGAPQ
ncbi:hypothetical protein [Erythrobacter sp. Alg231-14]|uniref:hypothetical protein n=1 Tax=Erythrobacter sp. Alg231-14 TaxID=1922225 RepID=UPI000D560683